MIWIAPSENDTDSAVLEKHFGDADEQAVPFVFKSQKDSRGRRQGLRIGLAFLCLALLATARPALAADALTRRTWTVDGTTRETLVYIPSQAKSNPAPVVFAFHGHGGSMQNAARTFSYHTRWPEAIVVYMQGLNTPGRLTDPEGKKPGWQSGVGDQGDRDLKFFDTVLAGLESDYRVDEKGSTPRAIPTAAVSPICSGRRAATASPPWPRPRRRRPEHFPNSNPSPYCTSPASRTLSLNSPGSGRRWTRCAN